MTQNDINAIMEMLSEEDKKTVFDKLKELAKKPVEAVPAPADINKPKFEDPPIVRKPPTNLTPRDPEFEDDIPIPASESRTLEAYDQMKVGQSCVFPNYKSTQGVVYRFKKKGWNFLIRKIHPDGTQVRLWRTG